MKQVTFVSIVVVAALVTAFAWRPAPPEVARLRAHFDTVDAELRGADVSQLTAGQRATRAQLINWLREYRDAGVFPRNDRIPDRYAPFFRDSRGVLCAMAYLIERSGHGMLVDAIARTRNNAYIAELASEPALVEWLRHAGLSVAEAARIQPTYEPPPEPRDTLSAGYANTSTALGALSLGSIGWNLNRPSRASGWAGMAAGAANIAAGLAEIGSDSAAASDVAAANLLVGTFAMAIARNGFDVAVPGPAPATLRFMPAVLPASGAPAVGIALVASF